MCFHPAQLLFLNDSLERLLDSLLGMEGDNVGQVRLCGEHLGRFEIIGGA